MRSALDEASFEAAWTEGRAMSPEQAIEYTLGEVEEPAAAAAAAAAAAPTMPHVPERTPSDKRPADTTEEAKTTTAGLYIFALGPALVEKDGRPLASSPDWILKPRELLYYLLCHPKGRTKEQIGLALWPDASQAQLRSSFHDAVFRLRRVLGGKEWVSFQKGRYAFDRSLPYSFDVEAFDEHLSEARRLRSESPEQAIRHLQKVVDLYRGDFLEDSAEGEWATERQEELSREYGEALLLLGRLLFDQGRHAEAAEAYRKAIAHDEMQEEAHRGLMRCQAALWRLVGHATLLTIMASVSEQDQSDGHEEETVRRRRRLHILVVALGTIAGATLGAFVPLVLLSDRHQASSDVPGVKSFENLSLQHRNGTITYEQSPPAGGEHDPVWQNAGFYEKQVLRERAVHTLEHGAVWITYRADLPEDQKEKLRRIVESQDCLLASPYPLSTPVVASAWGKQLRLKSVDDPKLQEFILAYRKGPQTPEPGAPCTGAAEMNPRPKDKDR